MDFFLKSNQLNRYEIVKNYENVCRTCLSETSELISLFTTSQLHNKTYAEKLAACTSVKVMETDEISLKICPACVNQIDQYYNFLQKCRDVNLILQLSQKLISQNKLKTHTDDTKELVVVAAMSDDKNNESDNLPSQIVEHEQNSTDKIQLENMNENYDDYITDNIMDDWDEIDTEIPEQKTESTNIKDETNDLEDYHGPLSPDVYIPVETDDFENDIPINFIKPDENSIFQCSICLICFISQSYLDKHLKTHPEQIYKCTTCELTCSQLAAYKKHQENKKYCCDICNRTFCIAPHLYRHKFIHQLNQRYFSCDECGLIVLDKCQLTRHLRVTHGINTHSDVNEKTIKEEDIEIGSTQFIPQIDIPEIKTENGRLIDDAKVVQCHICMRSWISEKHLEKHVEETHAQHPFKCDICGLTFSVIEYFRTHQEHHNEDNEFLCHTCDLILLTKSQFIHHAIVHSKRRYACHLCGLVMSKSSALDKHKLTHDNEKRICEICGATISPHNLSRHMKIHDTTKPHHCEKCGRGFIQRPALIKHKCDAPLKKPREPQPKPHICPYCPKATITDHALKLHIKSVHNIEPSTKKVYKYPKKPSITQLEKGKYPCLNCDRVFDSKKYLHRHARSHASTLDTECKPCKITFATYMLLQAHRREQHMKLKSHKCQQCGKLLSSALSLQIHERLHTGIKPYQCSYCDKSFRQPAHKYRHERLHTGEKPYVCVQCNKRFRHQTTLIDHVMIHNNELPYRCHVCNKSFCREIRLEKHLRTHK